jgi:uncharacterized protein YcbK (DUF882 family)
MGDLSEYFYRREFKCKCGKCNRDTVDVELLKCLTELRIFFKKRIFINSGIRCQQHNSTIGGSPNSQHLYGKAVDIVIQGIDPSKVATMIENIYPGKYGIGRYKTFTHFDVRDGCARWREK